MAEIYKTQTFCYQKLKDKFCIHIGKPNYISISINIFLEMICPLCPAPWSTVPRYRGTVGDFFLLRILVALL